MKGNGSSYQHKSTILKACNFQEIIKRLSRQVDKNSHARTDTYIYTHTHTYTTLWSTLYQQLFLSALYLSRVPQCFLTILVLVSTDLSKAFHLNEKKAPTSLKLLVSAAPFQGSKTRQIVEMQGGRLVSVSFSLLRSTRKTDQEKNGRWYLSVRCTWQLWSLKRSHLRLRTKSKRALGRNQNDSTVFQERETKREGGSLLFSLFIIISYLRCNQGILINFSIF